MVKANPYFAVENVNISSYLPLSQEARDPSLKLSVCFLFFSHNLLFLLWLLYNYIDSMSYSALSFSVNVVHVTGETKYKNSEKQPVTHTLSN